MCRFPRCRHLIVMRRDDKTAALLSLQAPMSSKFTAFAVAGRRTLPNQYDLAALAVVFAGIIAVVTASRGMTVSLDSLQSSAISLDYAYLPYYALRTTLRMFAAIAVRSSSPSPTRRSPPRAGAPRLVLIPLLDVLQSVPILGFLSFTVTFFLGLFPGSIARRRMRGDLRDLHEPGLEHGLLLLSVAAHRAARSRRSGARLPPVAPGSASGSSKRPSPCRA